MVDMHQWALTWNTKIFILCGHSCRHIPWCYSRCPYQFSNFSLFGFWWICQPISFPLFNLWALCPGHLPLLMNLHIIGPLAFRIREWRTADSEKWQWELSIHGSPMGPKSNLPQIPKDNCTDSSYFHLTKVDYQLQYIFICTQLY